MAATLPTGGALEQLADVVAARDQLIANQENLLNTYRCRFDIDTAAVPGGCASPAPAVPAAPPDNPLLSDVEARDRLIAAQEDLLNTYRCRFKIDTSAVPGGCVGGKSAGPIFVPPAEPPPATADVTDVMVFICAAEDRGYGQADLDYEVNLLNVVVGGFYLRESSGLATVRFVPGGVVSADIDWENAWPGSWKTFGDGGMLDCLLEAEAPPLERREDYLLILDIRGRGMTGEAWPGPISTDGLGKGFSLSVATTVEAGWTGWNCGPLSNDRPHRARDHPGRVMTGVSSGRGFTAYDVNCRYLAYTDYSYLVAHELGHSVYKLGHPPGCSIMSVGYTDATACPNIVLDNAMRFSRMLDGYYIDCADREKLGWPIAGREDCSSPPPPVAITFDLGSYSSEEGSEALIPVTLNTEPFRTLTVPLSYTFRGGATAADFGPLPDSVTFGRYDTTQTIVIPATADSHDEFGEEVVISFGEFPEDVSVGTAGTSWLSGPFAETVVGITEGAPPTVTISFGSDAYTIPEGDTRVQVTVHLDAAPERTLVIPLGGKFLLTDNGYNGRSDASWYYDCPPTIPREVVFAPHQTTKTLDVYIPNSPYEKVRLRFGDSQRLDGGRQGGSLPEGVVVGTPYRADINLENPAPCP